MHYPIHVVGMGAEGMASLSGAAVHQVSTCDLLYGGRRLLERVPRGGEHRVVITSNLKEVAAMLRAHLHKRQVVLASGDPNFFGIASYLYQYVGREHLDIEPNLSSIQLAFARIKESWNDAFFASVHGRSIEKLTVWVEEHRKVALLTDEVNHPGRIAQTLLAAGIYDVRMVVAENLGTLEERVSVWNVKEVGEVRFAPLNVVLLLRPAGSPDGLPRNPLFEGPSPRILVPSVPASQKNERTATSWGLGIDDHEYFQRKPTKGLLTKKEIRVISLAQLNLRAGSVVWDIGAGSGAMAMEARGLVGETGQVFAVEKNLQDLENVQKNAMKFGREIHLVHAEAPQGLNDLPAPDSIFIGGTGGRMAAIIEVCAARLRDGGRIVVNLATIEHLAEALHLLHGVGLQTEVVQLQVSRGKPIQGLTRFEPLNPVFVVTAIK